MLTERDIIEIKKLLNKVIQNGENFITLDKLNEVLAEKGYEVTTNKVTELTENSTDDQYPSAKTIVDLAEEWEFTLTDNSTVTRKMLCLISQP